MNERDLAVWSVAVGRWLRAHPLVEGGPGVRASLALTDLAAARLRLEPGGDAEAAFLASALVALPHRMRVKPGADADGLVRQAVRDALQAALDPSDDPGGGGDAEHSESDVAGDERTEVVVAARASGNQPATSEDEQALRAEFGDDEATRFLDDLLEPGPALPPTAGPALTRPGRRAVGDEILAVRPFRPGDRARDFSARQSVRASLRTGSLALRALSRQPSAVWDVVIAFDASASMGRDERPVVAPATAALTRVLIRSGHRVGAVAFSEEAVVARPLSRDRLPLLVERYRFAHATNVEAGIDAARLMLLREAVPGARRHVILVTDAECTSHSGSDEAWGPLGVPRGPFAMSRLLNGAMVEAARRAALIAASRCRRQGITVSVVYPDERAEVTFAHQLADAGGGRARCVRRAPE
ncbi:MAG TPA: VWA domain-containing protein [Acidimicrobiia bacterium]|nr:VWA domain-containing protein [Acidimicrobiia bacterium]